MRVRTAAEQVEHTANLEAALTSAAVDVEYAIRQLREHGDRARALDALARAAETLRVTYDEAQQPADDHGHRGAFANDEADGLADWPGND